jgi:hypothetical protein
MIRGDRGELINTLLRISFATRCHGRQGPINDRIVLWLLRCAPAGLLGERGTISPAGD